MLLNVTAWNTYLYPTLYPTNTGLRFAHAAGQIVETPITAMPPGTAAADITKFQDYANSDYFNVYTNLPISLVQASAPFSPSARSDPHDPELTTSPSSINAEARTHASPPSLFRPALFFPLFLLFLPLPEPRSSRPHSDPNLSSHPVPARQFALFTVPFRLGWNTLNLCPRLPVANPLPKGAEFGDEYVDWSVMPGREYSVQGCALTAFNASTCSR